MNIFAASFFVPTITLINYILFAISFILELKIMMDAADTSFLQENEINNFLDLLIN